MASCVKGLHRPADEPATGIHAPPPVMTGMFLSLYGIQKSRWEGSTAQLMSCCRMLFSRCKSANICAHLRVCVCVCVCVCACLYWFMRIRCLRASVRMCVCWCINVCACVLFKFSMMIALGCKYAYVDVIMRRCFSLFYVCACHVSLCTSPLPAIDQPLQQQKHF